MAKKALVLGAGASLAYGFPSGGDLRRRILALRPDQVREAGIISSALMDEDFFTQFQTAFLRSQMYSIDAFLGRRPMYATIGKQCIAAILLECENPKLLISESREKDHWYQYLFNQFAQRDWDDLTFDDISIVTFNYDRSLQQYLFVTLQSAYDKSAEEVIEKLKSLRIVHVYGSLCEAWPGMPDYFPYSTQVNPKKVELASSGLVVIPEGRADAETLKTARTWLAEADTVAFLGFGFDKTNVERLAEGDACAAAVQRASALVMRGFYGTCIGLHEAELKKSLRIFDGSSKYSTHSIGGFQNVNCTELLRSTQFLA